MTDTKLCTGCNQTKPLDSAHFGKRGELSRRDEFVSRCRDCVNARNRRRDRQREAELREVKHRQATVRGPMSDPAHVPTKVCWVCANLPHRVEGPTCYRCGLAHEAEAKVELVFRRTYIDHRVGF